MDMANEHLERMRGAGWAMVEGLKNPGPSLRAEPMRVALEKTVGHEHLQTQQQARGAVRR